MIFFDLHWSGLTLTECVFTDQLFEQIASLRPFRTYHRKGGGLSVAKIPFLFMFFFKNIARSFTKRRSGRIVRRTLITWGLQADELVKVADTNWHFENYLKLLESYLTKKGKLANRCGATTRLLDGGGRAQPLKPKITGNPLKIPWNFLWKFIGIYLNLNPLVNRMGGECSPGESSVN